MNNRLCTSSKNKSHRRNKEKKHKLKRNEYTQKSKVNYSDVSSEELSSLETDEIDHSRLYLKSTNIIDTLRITKTISRRNQLNTYSPKNNCWELEPTLENSSMSTNLSGNNLIEMSTDVKCSKNKKIKKSSKKPKNSNSKKKKEKTLKKQKFSKLSDCDINLKCSKYSDVELSKHNGDSIEPDTFIEESHTPPPIMKSTHIKDSKFRKDEQR